MTTWINSDAAPAIIAEVKALGFVPTVRTSEDGSENRITVRLTNRMGSGYVVTFTELGGAAKAIGDGQKFLRDASKRTAASIRGERE